MKSEVEKMFRQGGLFQGYGAYVLVDGQYGSTGKGLVAGALAEVFADDVDVVTTNAGPNSGHTSYLGDEKIVLKQLPTFGVVANKLFCETLMILNAGAIINPEIVCREIDDNDLRADMVTIHENASIVSSRDADKDQSNIASVGSTAQGTGPALIEKLSRRHEAVAKANKELFPPHVGWAGGIYAPSYIAHDETVFVEVAQGYSLGIDQPFYPFTTSRNCTVMQALADAEIHPRHYRQSVMVVRTYPIRVGGNSGPCYPDQKELSWAEIGQEPEYTTVTGRERRVFSWSKLQFMDAVAANRPDYVVLNFCNYLSPERVVPFVEENVVEPYYLITGTEPKGVILGFGPKSGDLEVY